LQSGGYLDAPGPREVLVEVELLLQLRELFGGEVGPARVVDTPRTARAPVEPVGFRR